MATKSHKKSQKRVNGSILLVDIGNTSVSVGIGKGRRISNFTQLDTAASSTRGVKNILAKVCRGKKLSGAILCSVVPGLTMTWSREMRNITRTRPLRVSHRLELGIGISYPRPETIGADRLANVSGAVALHGTPVIVADFGTALSFDVIDNKGSYVGGAIAPGLPLMTDYLAEKTALLPRIELKGLPAKVGRSTEGAMRIGAKVGYRGVVREIVSYLKEGMNLKKVKLCATGGYAKWALEGIGMKIDVHPDLTLYGLNVIYGLNKS